MKTDGVGIFVLRKIITTLVSTTIASLLLAFFSVKYETMNTVMYNQESHFLGMFMLFFIFVGAVILIYGNTVSIGVEYLQRKWFPRHSWLYILLLGLFGLANGVIFEGMYLAFYGMLAALLYAVIDKWVQHRFTRNKGIKMFFIVPLVTGFIMWGHLYFMSTPMPPFTAIDAVESATAPTGTVTDSFPRKVGIWEGTVDSYSVQKETKVRELDKEIYIVTFTENWTTDFAKGSWSLSYKVDRSSVSAYGETGNTPPYYR